MAKRKLRTPDVSAGGVFCGAFSLMAITGKSHEQACRSIRKANPRVWEHMPVRSMTTPQMIRSLRHVGLSVDVKRYTGGMWSSDKPTLAAWLRDRRGNDLHQCYVIALTTHFVVVSGNEFIDTFTKEPIKVDDCPHRRARVEEVITIGGKRSLKK